MFHDALSDDSIDRVMAVMALCSEMDFLVLTKRAVRMKKYMLLAVHWPIPNVWLGVSVEDQDRADERVRQLQDTSAAVRFLSIEPMLEEINLDLGDLHWVICGGESGSSARPFDIDWARSLRDQCRAAAVPFFMKQLGARPVEKCRNYCGNPQCSHRYGMALKDKKGGDPAEWPVDLRVQEFPNATK